MQKILKLLIFAFLIIICFITVTCIYSMYGLKHQKIYTQTTYKDTTQITTIAFGSCHDPFNARWYDFEKKDMQIWNSILADKPNLWIWTGDIIYPDKIPGLTVNDMDRIETMYAKLKQFDFYKQLLKNTTVIGVWDDHDFGSNNGGIEYAHKEEVKKFILDFLDEPQNSPRRKQNGIYTAYNYNTKNNKQLKVILLDVRYFREKAAPNAQILGNEQWQWFENELKADTADVTLIISGTEIIAVDQQKDKWLDYPKEHQHLLNLLTTYKPKNTILISGDRHFAEMNLLKDEKTGYELFEIMSSGMTHTSHSCQSDINRYRLGKQYCGKNYGFLQINWQLNPVQVTCLVKNEAGETVIQTIRK